MVLSFLILSLVSNGPTARDTDSQRTDLAGMLRSENHAVRLFSEVADGVTGNGYGDCVSLL
jgi:hypothetical protein